MREYDLLITEAAIRNAIAQGDAPHRLRLVSDPFDDECDDEYLDRLFAGMALCPQHTFQVLTKRPERMAEWLTKGGGPLRGSFTRKRGCEWKTPSDNVYSIVHCRPRSREVIERGMVWPLPNVWLGTSVEDQEQADARVPHLLRCPAAVRFLSCEPLLGPVDLTNLPASSWGAKYAADDYRGITLSALHGGRGTSTPWCIDWVIVGGESGRRARACDVAWVRSVVRQCADAGVPAFVKQLGACYSDAENGVAGYSLKIDDDAIALLTHRLRHSKGGDPAEWPDDLRVREFPREREAVGRG